MPRPSARSSWTRAWCPGRARRTSRQAPGCSPARVAGGRPGGGGSGPGRPGSAVRGDGPLDRLGEVLPQVGLVGDLDRVRRPGAGAVREGAGAVTADHLDAGTGGQPVRERLGVAALQQVERGAGLAVDQQGAVVCPRLIAKSSTPSTRGTPRPGPGWPSAAVTRPGGRGHAEPRQAGNPPGPASATAMSPAPRPAAGSSARSGRSGPGPARRTSSACSRIGAEEPADGQPDHHPAPADRGVSQPPGITAVDPARHRAARRAGRVRRHAPWPARQRPAAAATSSTITPARCGRRTPSSTDQGMTSTRRLATMTPRTPGRTAGVDNRRTTRSPSRHTVNPPVTPNPPNPPSQGQMPSRNRGPRSQNSRTKPDEGDSVGRQAHGAPFEG